MIIATASDLANFHRFLGEHLQRSKAPELTPEEALALWRDQTETLADIREGLADIEAGRVTPLDQFDREFRSRHQIADAS